MNYSFKTLIFFNAFFLVQIYSFAQKGSTCPEDLIPKYGSNRQWGYTNLIGEWVVEPIYTKVTPYVDNKAVVMKGNLYGVIDCEGNIVLPPQYELMTSLRYGKFWVKNKNLWGIIDSKGKVLMPPQYAEIAPIANTEFTWVMKENLWGLINEKNGSYLCKPQYKMAQIMSENASLVEVGDKYGVVNHVNCSYLIQPNITKVKKVGPRMIIFKQENKWGLFSEFGVLRLKPEFDTLYFKYNNLIEGKKNGLFGLYDLSGKEVLLPEYEYIGDFSEGYFLVNKKGKFGYATRFGKLFIQPTYDEAYDFKDKKAIVRQGKKYGIIDVKNKLLMPLQYSNIIGHPSGKYYAVKQLDQKKGTEAFFFFNDQLKKMTEKSYDSIYTSDSLSFTRVKEKGKTYFFNIHKGTLVFPAGYETVVSINDHYVIVKESNKYGIIDRSSKVILPSIYDSLSLVKWGARNMFFVKEAGNNLSVVDEKGKIILKDNYELVHYTSAGILKIKKGGLFGIAKSSGEILVTPVYSEMTGKFNPTDTLLPEWPAIVSKEGKKGLINEKGEEISKAEFSNILYLGDHLYSLKSNKNNTIVTSKGQPINEEKFDAVNKTAEGLMAVKKGKKWGYINNKGMEVIPYQYAMASDFVGKCAVVQKGELYGAIDQKGKWVIEPIYVSYEYKNSIRSFQSKDGKSFILKENCQVLK